MNRGSLRWPRAKRSTTCSFNEAPIHESGKSRAARRTCWTTSSFNEAPIHESGKSLLFDQASVLQFDASMRPRFMNRGSWVILRSVVFRKTRFNEAPIHESGK